MKYFAIIFFFLSSLGGLNAQCLGTWDTSSAPGYGGVGTFYEAGETIEICLRVNTWSSASANWFHGFEIILGPGWDPATLAATSFAPSCDGNGVWGLYPSITSSATGATFGPGIYYDSPSGAGGLPIDGDPGNNYGDFNSCSAPHWVQFCFEVTTLDFSACIEGADLSIILNTLGDGEAGSWSSFNCNLDPDIVFSGPELTCCDPPLIDFTDPLCAGDATGQITATGNTFGPYLFNWSTGFSETTPDVSSISGLAAGTYTLVMTDGDACTSTTEIVLTDPPVIEFSLDSLVHVACPDGSNGLIAVTATGGTGLGTFSYSLDGGAYEPIGFFMNLSVGTYTITARDANGCEADYEVVVIEENVLTPLVLNVINNLCFADSAGVVQGGATGGYPPYLYSLDGESWQEDDAIGGLLAGDYTLFVQDMDGCIVSIPFSVTEPEQLTLDAGTYLPIPSGTGVVLEPETNADPVASWTWSPTNDLSCVNCPNPEASPPFEQWYTLTVVDANGCVVIDSTLIEVIRDFAIPNAFSPNGDGINDVFVIRTPYLVEFALRIFNRWGEEVFASNDIMVAWDGTFQGKPQEVGTYIYFLDAVNDEGERVRRSGSVILVR